MVIEDTKKNTMRMLMIDEILSQEIITIMIQYWDRSSSLRRQDFLPLDIVTMTLISDTD